MLRQTLHFLLILPVGVSCTLAVHGGSQGTSSTSEAGSSGAETESGGVLAPRCEGGEGVEAQWWCVPSVGTCFDFKWTRVESLHTVGLAALNLNGDSTADLVTFLGSPDGMMSALGTSGCDFKALPILDLSGALPESAMISDSAIGDLDADGLDDLVLKVDSNDVAVFLGTENGPLFHQSLELSFEVFPLELGDVDGDGVLDLITAQDTVFSHILVNFGRGDGTLGPFMEGEHLPGWGEDFSNSSNSFLTSFDANGDNVLDLAYGQTEIFETLGIVMFGHGDGFFPQNYQLPHEMGSNGEGNQVAQGDFNGDGRVDLVVPGFQLLGVGESIESQRPFDYASTQFEEIEPVVADLDRDGYDDLLLKGRWHFGGPKGLGSRLPLDDLYEGVHAHAVADFNGDGLLDVALAAEGRLEVHFGAPRQGRTVRTGVQAARIRAGETGLRERRAQSAAAPRRRRGAAASAGHRSRWRKGRRPGP